MNSHIGKTILLFLVIHGSFSSGVCQNRSVENLHSIPLRKYFNPSEFGGGIQSWAFDQDSVGFLYVANNKGLLEFDGNSWDMMDVPDCQRVRAVNVVADNKIFVGGQGQIGYFNMTENGFKFHSLLNLLPKDKQVIAETWKIIEHRDKIYFRTESRLLVYDGEKIVDLDLPGYIQQLFKLDNQIIVKIYGAGLFIEREGRFIPIEGSDEIPEIVTGVPGISKNIFITSTGKFFVHEEDSFSQIDIPLHDLNITSALALDNGDYAIGTQNSGLYLLNPDLSLRSHLTKNRGLSSRTVKAIYEDGFNNLWVAINNGIDYIELNLPLSLINEDLGLEGTGYAACGFNGKIYFGTSNGLFTGKGSGQEDSMVPYELVRGSDGQVYNLSEVGGDLFLNHNRGAFQIEGDKIEQFHDIGSWKLISTAVPGLAIGGDYRGMAFFRKKDGQWVYDGLVSDLNESSRVLEYENDSTLWMTHALKGAYRFRFDGNMNLKGQPKRFGQENGFPSDKKISVYSLNDDLVFTSENGIYTFDKSNSEFVPNSFFGKWLGNKHASEIITDENGAIYYIQDLKMGMLYEEKFGTYKKKSGLFTHINKLINDDLPNITILDEQNVLVGAKEGFILYNPEKKFDNNSPFKVIIRSIDIDMKEDTILTIYPGIGEHVELKRKQSLKFNFTSPYFEGFEDLKYSYRMVPLDDKWSEWSSEGEMKYPFMPPGDYTFEVKAKNVYQEESETATFSFSVLKPWYLSKWAVLAYIFVGTGIIVFLFFKQKQKHLAESSLITQQSEQALKTKDEKINQISEESKNEIDRLRSEKLKSELNLKNDQLTTITMHLMNTNSFLQSIRDQILAFAQSRNDTNEIKGLLKKIDDQISNNNAWDQFEYHFDQVHSGYLKKLSENNVKLSPREIKLASFLRMNMSTKEIADILNISNRGVELARYRLRKKLNLSRDQNLVEYLIDLDYKNHES